MVSAGSSLGTGTGGGTDGDVGSCSDVDGADVLIGSVATSISDVSALHPLQK